jgi:hypothetical protein
MGLVLVGIIEANGEMCEIMLHPLSDDDIDPAWSHL